MPGGGMPTLPRAIWFFYGSLPSNMSLALDVPGYGWKAATIDALRPSALARGIAVLFGRALRSTIGNDRFGKHFAVTGKRHSSDTGPVGCRHDAELQRIGPAQAA